MLDEFQSFERDLLKEKKKRKNEKNDNIRHTEEHRKLIELYNGVDEMCQRVNSGKNETTKKGVIAK